MTIAQCTHGFTEYVLKTGIFLRWKIFAIMPEREYFRDWKILANIYDHFSPWNFLRFWAFAKICKKILLQLNSCLKDTETVNMQEKTTHHIGRHEIRREEFPGELPQVLHAVLAGIKQHGFAINDGTYAGNSGNLQWLSNAVVVVDIHHAVAEILNSHRHKLIKQLCLVLVLIFSLVLVLQLLIVVLKSHKKAG